MEKITVIVPVYNVELYLRDCIDSIINQTYTNLEIILVNDGSTDTSLDICKEYASKNKNIKIINKENGGLSDARNAGLEKATGEYIMFVDSDDFLTPTSCELLYNSIKEHDVEFVSANFVFTNEEGVPWQKPKFSENFQSRYLDIDDYLYSFYLINSIVWNKIFKKEFLDKNKLRFKVGLLAEDAHFTTLVFLKAKKTYYLKDVVYNYRQRKNNKSNLSISYHCSEEYFKKVNESYKIIYENFKKYNQMNFYKYYYAKSIAYILYKFVDSVLLTDKERINVLKEMKWFFNIKKEIGIPIVSSTIDIITDGIINEEYDNVLKYCKILSEAREYMTSEERENMARPDYNKYKKI